MTLLELIITAHRCRSTHHFIAIDALKLLNGKDADVWHDLMLRHHQSLLEGAKAPDTKFKDFKNHVLHIGEGEWGGARDAAMEWYGRAVTALRAEKWSKAAYALGVMTHYYADPIQPFHTAQSEEEGAIHRALEWSIAQSRHKIEARIAEKGYPTVSASQTPGFVSEMVRAGAERSHPHYQTLIDHYDLHAGVKDPQAGLDDTLIEIVSDLIAYATAGVAVLFDRAFAEAAVQPQKVELDLPGYLAALDIPIRWVTKRMADASDRRAVEAMYEELQTTGKVIKTLPADDKKIRKLHAEQVLRKPLSDIDAQPLKPIGVKHGAGTTKPTASHQPQVAAIKAIKTPEPAPLTPEPAPAKPELKAVPHVEIKPMPATQPEPGSVSASVLAQMPAPDKDDAPEAEPGRESEKLTRSSPVVDAPSIGPKTAARLAKVNIVTVGDLMDADADTTATVLDVRYIKAETIKDWQDQTGLMLAMPGLRVLDSQILVGAGIRSANALASASSSKVLKAATSFLDTPSGSRILWGAQSNVDEGEVASWIDLAKKSAA